MNDDSAVLGVDGCPGGWVGALVRSGSVTWHAGSLASLLALPAAVVAIDIPLALPVAGERRACEVAARAVLGAQRSSVFFAPPRAVLDAADHADASVRARAAGSVGVSIQTWNIVPKIAEAMAFADPRLIEVHPELSFRALVAARVAARPSGRAGAGRTATLNSKKSAQGRAERLALLRTWVDVDLPSSRPGGAAVDDCLDALVCAWTAQRWLAGTAAVLGEEVLGGRLSRIVS
jgi:predicted RNase H-like nuclease